MKIKELRQKNNISQTELAKKLEVSQKSISNYEKGLSTPDIETLIKIADYFHTTIDNLVGHNVPYLLDKSLLSEKQKQLLEQLITLDDKQCEIVNAYIMGIKLREEEKENIINKLKGE